jgi:protein-disulfide isomerase
MAKRKQERPRSASRPARRDTGRWRILMIGSIAVLALAAIVGLFFIVLGPEKQQRKAEFVYHGIQGGFTEEGFPYLGSLEAPVVVMEFTDFNCSHCQAYNLETEDSILADYVATGKVRYVLHYNSSANPRSLQASEAAMCAGEQGLYFQFQRALFENPAALREDFMDRARDVGLDVDGFKACWDAGRYRSKLIESTQAARSMGISATPSFRINDQLVVGHRPDEIRQAIEDELVKAGQ